MATLIAFDTATERMTVALRHRERVFAHDGEGGARASATLLPAILALLAEAGIALADLDAIAFGRGPGAFTGLRTACSVAQGLAFGAGRPVLPIDSLLAVAEDARGDAASLRLWALIDARMDQIYAAEYEHDASRWTTRVAPFLTDCDALAARWRAAPPAAIAGNAIGAFGARLKTGEATLFAAATPSALALLRLAAQGWADGVAVDPALALPLYVRDKVADTEAERAAQREKGAPKEPAPPSRREGSEAGREQPDTAQRSEAGREQSDTAQRSEAGREQSAPAQRGGAQRSEPAR
ncbi:MAG TPA: tRNA (adenosine(37)-N6)-threonylcarbamoyltransferase complex dimerization subunit type 1 TsaB [Caldimonas sp.]|jgi:tRNA threonylcarbamoyladenosine biosynthesis protein TsaB|nr:tRNA (adenosine(37)-N6)-threonylcarbamoyltransferase complex dimerization subunit type 1 TsaB [Caldimonas sp.]HEV7578547.1 tRNA (adenosine(37)-N6)-threonylcarbamoyltransferase complex dimerization subunit type 1 TsaB [Caldimonas sp.]